MRSKDTIPNALVISGVLILGGQLLESDILTMIGLFWTAIVALLILLEVMSV